MRASEAIRISNEIAAMIEAKNELKKLKIKEAERLRNEMLAAREVERFRKLAEEETERNRLEAL